MAILGKNANFLKGATAIGKIEGSIEWSVSRETVDVTHMQSADDYREFIPALYDGGSVSLTIQYEDDETLSDLLADFHTKAAVAYKIVMPIQTGETTAASIEFNAFLTELPVSIPIDDKVTISLSFQITGKPTVTAAS